MFEDMGVYPLSGLLPLPATVSSTDGWSISPHFHWIVIHFHNLGLRVMFVSFPSRLTIDATSINPSSPIVTNLASELGPRIARDFQLRPSEPLLGDVLPTLGVGASGATLQELLGPPCRSGSRLLEPFAKPADKEGNLSLELWGPVDLRWSSWLEPTPWSSSSNPIYAYKIINT